LKDVNFVSFTGFRNWAIDHLITSYSHGLEKKGIKCVTSEIPQNLSHIRSLRGWLYFPFSKVDFVMHQDLLDKLRERRQRKQKTILRYTHHNKDFNTYSKHFQYLDYIIVENQSNKRDFIQLGIAPEKISVLPHPVDPNYFYPIEGVQKTRDVILVSAFYERKQPDLIMGLIRNNPTITFTIFGKNWQNYNRYNSLKSLSNLKIMPFDWETYPSVLRSHKVFMSLSLVESGPVPLLESLSCGLRVIATNTGTAPDLINHHGRVVPVTIQVEELEEILKKELEVSREVTFNNENFTEAFQIEKIVQIVKSLI
jgi:glycosyltransferase involved in cell wall biosynthesis